MQFFPKSDEIGRIQDGMGIDLVQFFLKIVYSWIKETDIKKPLE